MSDPFRAIRQLERLFELNSREAQFVDMPHPVELMPLEEAMYCVNCGMVTRATDSAKACAVCGDPSALLSLARALYRDGEAVA